MAGKQIGESIYCYGYYIRVALAPCIFVFRLIMRQTVFVIKFVQFV